MSKPHHKDERLLLQIKEGNTTLLKGLYDQYWDSFYAFILKKNALSKELVLDIYNQSFSVLYFKIKNGTLQPPLRSSLKTFLFSVGLNHLRRYLEKKGKEKEDLYEDFGGMEHNITNTALNDYEDRRAAAEQVSAWLSQLDGACRELLTLSYIKEYADDAVASQLGIPSNNAVRQRRFKCLEKLRTLLNVNTKTDE